MQRWRVGPGGQRVSKGSHPANGPRPFRDASDPPLGDTLAPRSCAEHATNNCSRGIRITTETNHFLESPRNLLCRAVRILLGLSKQLCHLAVTKEVVDLVEQLP
jgi:hypothetical protein